MSSLAEIEAAAEALSAEEQEQLIARIGAKLAARETRSVPEPPQPDALDRWFAEIHEAMRQVPASPTPRDILEEGRNRLERF